MDGIITSCCSGQLPRQLMQTLELQRYPLFTLCGRSDYDFSSSAPDYSEALPAAVRSLAEKGHRTVTLCLFEGKKADNARNRLLFLKSCRQYGVEPDFRIHNERGQAASLADRRLPAVILYGKYSMRIYQDRCRELNLHPDIVGIYNEWTLAAARDFSFHGIILEQAEEAVRSAVRQVIAQIGGMGISHIRPRAKYVPQSKIRSLKLQNLANQMLFELP